MLSLRADLLTVRRIVTRASTLPTLRDSSLTGLSRLCPAKPVECIAIAAAMSTNTFPNERWLPQSNEAMNWRCGRPRSDEGVITGLSSGNHVRSNSSVSGSDKASSSGIARESGRIPHQVGSAGCCWQPGKRIPQPPKTRWMWHSLSSIVTNMARLWSSFRWWAASVTYREMFDLSRHDPTKSNYDGDHRCSSRIGNDVFAQSCMPRRDGCIQMQGSGALSGVVDKPARALFTYTIN